MWKTGFKKIEVIWFAEADHITSNFLKAVLTHFTWSILEYLVPYNLVLLPSLLTLICFRVLLPQVIILLQSFCCPRDNENCNYYKEQFQVDLSFRIFIFPIIVLMIHLKKAGNNDDFVTALEESSNTRNYADKQKV